MISIQQEEPCRNCTAARRLLICDGLQQSDLFTFCPHHKIAGPIDVDVIRASQFKADRSRRRPRRYNEVIFEVLTGAVVDEIDPPIDICVSYLRITGDTAPPLLLIVSDEVVRDARQLFQTLNCRICTFISEILFWRIFSRPADL
jgi:hypothetical protein